MKFIFKTPWIVCCLLSISLFDPTIHPVLASGSALQLQFRENRLSISADDADIQTVLLRVSEETGIFIRFPKALQKKISITLSSVTLEHALKSLLKGLNYATVFSISENEDKIRISKVYIFKGYKETARTRRLARRERQNRNRINQYKKRIESIQRRLNDVSNNSAAARRLKRQLQNYQKQIDRLERQIR
jgi:ribosomal protein L24